MKVNLLEVSSTYDSMGLKFTLGENSISLSYEEVLNLKRAISALFDDQYNQGGEPYVFKGDETE